MKRMKKRLLAMLLVLMMVVSLLPTGALADTNSDSKYISIGYAKDGGITSALTVIVNGPDGATLDTIGPFEVYSPSNRMTVSIKDEYIGVYEFDTCAINTDGGQSITGWGAADDTAIKQDFSYNIYKDEATITITLKNAENTLSLRNEEMGIDIGTITYLPGSEDRADINIYLNYQPVCAFEDVGITGTRANNFVIRTNDGFYYGDAQNNIIGAALSGNMLTFGAGDDHTVDLYFFTYDDGFDVDFERTVNLTTLDIDDACPSLDISFTYGGEDYSITYDEWNAINAIYLPKGTDIHVSPDIQEHYGFNFWMDSDTWTEGNVIYTVDAEGNLTDTSPRSHSQDMVINYSATGFNRALIYLRMNSGTNVYPFYTVSYDANGGIGSMSDQTFAEFYVYIKDNEFTKEGCEFVGWNTAADGSGTEYAPNTQYSDKQDLTLYAQWKETGTTPDPDPDEPPAPTDADLSKLAVVLKCVNEDVEHTGDPKTFNLRTTNCIYDIEQNSGQYICTVTPNYDLMLQRYNEQVAGGHTYANEVGSEKTFTLVWVDGAWNNGNAEPITRQVKCDTQQGGEDPDAPDAKDIIAALGNGAVQVVCDNPEAQHEPKSKSYALAEDSFTFTPSKIDKDGKRYLVTIDAKDNAGTTYLNKYNKDTDTTHTMVRSLDGTSAYVTFMLEGNTWTADDANPLFTVTVHCDNSGEQPGDDDKPNPPTEDDLEDDPDKPDDPAIFKGTPIVVDCITADVNHPDGNYRLLRGTYEIGDVEGDVATGYTCDITIKAADYIYLYEETYNAHMLENEADKEIVVPLTYDQNEEAWKLPGGFTNVTFNVTCNTTQLPGEDHYYPYPVKPEDPTDPDQTGVSDLLETDDHIQYLFGYPDGSFGPDRNMTRAEAAQMFYNLLKNKNVDAEPAFDDVPDGAWYATPVNVMAELRIVDGVGDDKFEPNREITRAEFTTMAMRFAKVPSGGVNIFTDVNPDDWFYSYVVNSIQYGWIEGYGDGTFRPDRLITRAEVTTIVNRMLDRQADMAFVIQNRDKLTKFTDLTTEHWAYYTIVEATNEHNYKKPAIGEDWTSLIK